MNPNNHRIRKVMMLKNSIDNSNKTGDFASREKLIAEMSKQWGTERRKALEYLNELYRTSQILIEEDDVWLSKYTIEQMERFKKDSEVKELKDYIGEENGTTTRDTEA